MQDNTKIEQTAPIIPQDGWTLLDWAKAGLEKLKASDAVIFHGYIEPIDEICSLLAHVTGLSLPLSEDDFKTVLTENAESQFCALLDERIAKRKPVAYLINKAWQLGYEFYVDERVLIPRSPIADLIARGFEPWLKETKLKTALDIGTGSGVLAILLKMFYPDCAVTGVDISDEAIEVCNINNKTYSNKVSFIKSDCFEALGDAKYDLILANPPYVPSGEYESLPDEFSHEPKGALEAGSDGLDVTRRILIEASLHLTEIGILICEVGTAAEYLIKAYPNVPFIWLEFESDADGVFLLEKKDLREHFNK